jgi:flagellar export protein FliJ
VREQKRLLHAEAVQYQRNVEQQIGVIEQVRDAEKEILRQSVTSPEISVDKVIASRTYDGLLGNFRRNLDRQLHQVEQVVETRRQDLVAAERDVRILEKLEEKLRSRYNDVLDHGERVLMDELAGQSVARRKELFG